MSRVRNSRVTWAARIAGIGIAALALGAATIPAASASVPLPNCSSVDPGTATNYVAATHCWYNAAGSGENAATGNAGYAGINDNHTHYRYVQTLLTNTPQLVNLNGPGRNEQGTVGVLLCDPNNHAFGAGGWAAEEGLFGNGGLAGVNKNTVFYAAGFWPSGSPDPCLNDAPLVPNPDAAPGGNCPPGGAGSVTAIAPPGGSSSPTVFCGSFQQGAPGQPNVGLNDQLAFSVQYVAGSSRHHEIQFSDSDITQGRSFQAYSHVVTLNIWEFGIGAFSASQSLTSMSLSNPVDVFTGNQIACYSCAGPVNITQVQPVNPFGIGGLIEVQDANVSGQVTMGPANSLTLGGFTIYNGSTSS